MKVIIQHDADCPLGINGLRAYVEARDAFATMPPEARSTEKDRRALAAAEFELDQKQICTCGALKLQRFMRSN